MDAGSSPTYRICAEDGICEILGYIAMIRADISSFKPVLTNAIPISKHNMINEIYQQKFFFVSCNFTDNTNANGI
jgi:hypothetical protein